MSELYPHSVNTVRLVTVMVGGVPQPFFGFLRMGNKGCRCDNWSVGGILVGIDIETGRVFRDGVYMPGCGTRVSKHPETGVVFESFEIPFYAGALEMALQLHRFFYGSHSIGWDIAITESGPCVIEGNDNWAIAPPQAVHGGMRTKYLDVYPKELLGR